MSIKKLINALFQMSGSRAMPNFSSDQVTSTLTNEEANLVAPFDGYLLLHSIVNKINPTNNELSITDVQSNTRLITNQGVFGGNWIDFIVPVRKGHSYTVRMIECESGLYSFFKLVGGAKSLFAQAVRCVRGGGLCLRHFSNHCSRFLLKSLKLRGLAHKRFHDQATEFRWSVHNTEHILRQMMAILAFMSHRKAHLICTQPGTELELHHVLHQVINTQHRGQLQFERATLSPGCVIKSRLSCGSFLQKVDNSLIATEVCHG